MANNDIMPSARKSVWNDPDVLAVHPIFKRVLDWMSTVEGPFPMPYNLRFSELHDTWVNTSRELFYGEVSFEEGIARVQTECRTIMNLSRP